VADLLDPGAASVAGVAHGQIATAIRKGGLAVSAHKVLEEGARALLIYVPGVLRIDVRPLEDGLQVIPRPLYEGDFGWEIDESALTDYGKTALETQHPANVAFRFALWSEPVPTVGRLLLSYSRARAHGPSHFVGHAVIMEVEGGA
jgi:hypothetical protein